MIGLEGHEGHDWTYHLGLSLKLGGDAGNVVIRQEVDERHLAIQHQVALHCRVELPEVVLLQRRPEGFG